MARTIDLQDAIKQVSDEMANWEQQDLLAAARELLQLLPSRGQEQWLIRQLVDKDGNSPTITQDK